MIIVWLKSGHAVVGGQQLPIGRPVLYAGRQQVQWDRFQKDVMRIDQAIVEHVAAERGGWEPGPLEFKPNHVPDGAPLAAWWLMIRTIASEILSTTGKSPSTENGNSRRWPPRDCSPRSRTALARRTPIRTAPRVEHRESRGVPAR